MLPWYRQKTTWTLIAGILAAVGGYLTNEISLITCIGTCMGALSGIFLRQGIEKSGPNSAANVNTTDTNIYHKAPSDRGVSLDQTPDA